MPRSQARERNPNWLGDQAGYAALHQRVRVTRGTPSECQRCGTTDPTLRYEWANLTGRYADLDDYERMCKHCHQVYDISRRELSPIEHGTSAGWLTHRRRSEQPCEDCRLARNTYTRQWYRKRNLIGEFDVAPVSVAV